MFWSTISSSWQPQTTELSRRKLCTNSVPPTSNRGSYLVCWPYSHLQRCQHSSATHSLFTSTYMVQPRAQWTPTSPYIIWIHLLSNREHTPNRTQLYSTGGPDRLHSLLYPASGIHPVHSQPLSANLYNQFASALSTELQIWIFFIFPDPSPAN